MSSPFKIPSSCEEMTWREAQWGELESDHWPEGFPQPRTCGFCGSVHPDDLMVLVKLGWTCEMSTKSYKSYWHPPVNPNSVVPPVKLYSNHVTDQQAAELNRLLRAAREN